MCPDSKCCEFCGGPNHLTVHIKTGYNTIIPMIMCYNCFMRLVKAEGEKSATAGDSDE